MRLAPGLLVTLGLPSLLACAPRTVPPPVQEAEPAPFDPKPAPRVEAETAALTPEEIAALLPPPEPRACGMPEGIYQPGWPRTLTPTSLEEQPAFVTGTVSLAVLPDTQYYARCRNKHLENQRAWVERVRTERNIRGLLTLGDLTDANTDAEWDFFKRAITPADPTLPVILTTGNHDYGEGGTANRRHSLFAQYFERSFANAAVALEETLEPTNLENAFYIVDLGRLKLGVLSLEWSPRAKTVGWANGILSKYPKLRTVITTHAYLYSDDTRYDFATHADKQAWNPRAYRTNQGDEAAFGAHDGEMLWQELVRKHANVFLVLSGHVLNDGAGQLSSPGDHGNVVHQLLSNYQMLNEGGLGYLRLLEFLPDGRTLRVKTYSPSLGLFATAPDQNFNLTLEPPLWAAAR